MKVKIHANVVILKPETPDETDQLDQLYQIHLDNDFDVTVDNCGTNMVMYF